jgi:FSR family fosmidomycin resistance protein-like MFS transporter
MPTTQTTPTHHATGVASITSESTATATWVLINLSVSHLLNDSIQALIPAIYPLLKDSFRLSFTQIGLITLTFQMVGSILQPLVGLYTDRRPQPKSLVIGMAVTLVGLVVLAFAPAYPVVLAAAALIGIGSAIFHPESSRMARLASGGRHGFAQSLFQVGGNLGTALGPLLAAWIIVPHGQRYVLAFSLVAIAGMALLARVGDWHHRHWVSKGRTAAGPVRRSPFRGRRLVVAVGVLLALMFSKFFYLASMTSYYTFYLMQEFGVSVQGAQFYLFLFLGAGVIGTFLGGAVGDRIGRKPVIWISILGAAPFSLLMPHAGPWGTACLSALVALVMASAFPAILVYAMELLPGNVGLVAGLFFGLAFGLAGIGSAVLGWLADLTSIRFVMHACAYLPLIGLVTWFLPEVDARRHPRD